MSACNSYVFNIQRDVRPNISPLYKQTYASSGT